MLKNKPAELAISVSFLAVVFVWIGDRPLVAGPKTSDDQSSPPFFLLTEGSLPEHALARLGSLRFRTGSSCFPLTFSQDGKTLAGVAHGRVFLWDSETGALKKLLSHPKKRHIDMSFLGTDGADLISLTEDGSIVCWNYLSGKEVLRRTIEGIGPGTGQCIHCVNQQAFLLKGRDGTLKAGDFKTGKDFGPINIPGVRLSDNPLQTACISPDGRTVALAFTDLEDVFLWDVRSSSLVGKLPGDPDHPDQVLMFSPNGKYLAAAVYEGKGRVWDWRNLVVKCQFQDGRKVRFSPVGNALVVWDAQVMRILDVATGQILLATKAGPSWNDGSDAISPNGKMLAIGTVRGTVRRWDLVTGQEIPLPTGHGASITSLVFDKKGTSVLSSALDQTTRRWGLPSGELLSTRHCPSSLTLAPDGILGATLIPFKDSEDLQLSDIRSGNQVVKKFDGVTDYYFPSEASLVYRTSDDALVFYDTNRHKEQKRFFLQETVVGSLAFSEDLHMFGGRLNMAFDEPGGLALWSGDTGKVLRRFSNQKGGAAAISPDARMMATTNPQHEVQVFECQTEKEILRVPIPEGSSSFCPLLFGPDNRTLAVPTWLGEIVLWDVFAGEQLAKFQGHRAQVTAMKFSVDGSLLASGGRDTTAVIWKIPGKAGKVQSVGEKMGLLWDDLASENPRKAYLAMAEVLGNPSAAAKFFENRLRATAALEPKLLDGLIGDLDNPTFSARDAATRKLAELGDLAVPALREALIKNSSLELRRRVNTLLDQIDRRPVTAPEQIRAMRAIQVLEHCGSLGKPLLAKMSTGFPESVVTQEAQRSLRRLSKKLGANEREN